MAIKFTDWNTWEPVEYGNFTNGGSLSSISVGANPRRESYYILCGKTYEGPEKEFWLFRFSECSLHSYVQTPPQLRIPISALPYTYVDDNITFTIDAHDYCLRSRFEIIVDKKQNGDYIVGEHEKYNNDRYELQWDSVDSMIGYPLRIYLEAVRQAWVERYVNVGSQNLSDGAISAFFPTMDGGPDYFLGSLDIRDYLIGVFTDFDAILSICGSYCNHTTNSPDPYEAIPWNGGFFSPNEHTIWVAAGYNEYYRDTKLLARRLKQLHDMLNLMVWARQSLSTYKMVKQHSSGLPVTYASSYEEGVEILNEKIEEFNNLPWIPYTNFGICLQIGMATIWNPDKYGIRHVDWNFKRVKARVFAFGTPNRGHLQIRSAFSRYGTYINPDYPYDDGEKFDLFSDVTDQEQSITIGDIDEWTLPVLIGFNDGYNLSHLSAWKKFDIPGGFTFQGASFPTAPILSSGSSWAGSILGP